MKTLFNWSSSPLIKEPFELLIKLNEFLDVILMKSRDLLSDNINFF